MRRFSACLLSFINSDSDLTCGTCVRCRGPSDGSDIVTWSLHSERSQSSGETGKQSYFYCHRLSAVREACRGTEEGCLPQTEQWKEGEKERLGKAA